MMAAVVMMAAVMLSCWLAGNVEACLETSTVSLGRPGLVRALFAPTLISDPSTATIGS
jgi:hypothetical protein